MSRMSGTQLPGYFQFQARPAGPLRQEQESQMSAGMGKDQSYDSSSDVIARGAGGMGPCPRPQHQPPGGAYALDIH